jgi:hypothetical protein
MAHFTILGLENGDAGEIILLFNLATTVNTYYVLHLLQVCVDIEQASTATRAHAFFMMVARQVTHILSLSCAGCIVAKTTGNMLRQLSAPWESTNHAYSYKTQPVVYE